MACVIKYVFQIKQKILILAFSKLLQEKMNRKHLERIYHANVTVHLMEENGIQINVGIAINVDVSVKNETVENIMFGILLHVIVKMVNI